MQRKPKLVAAFVAMQRAIWDPDSKVDRGFKRIIAHVASRTAGDPYSMAHTASGALHFGIAEDKLAAAWDYRASSLFSVAETAALDLAVAASSLPNAVTDGMFADLRRHWSDDEIVEIVATIAMAGFLARWNATLATPLEPEPLATGRRYLAPLGWSPGATLERDDFSSNRHPALAFCWSMIFSENRYPLFGIMRQLPRTPRRFDGGTA